MDNGTIQTEKKSQGTLKYMVLGGALGLALAGNGYLLVRSNAIADQVNAIRDAHTAQLQKIQEASATEAEESRAQIEKMSRSITDAQTVAANANAALKRTQADRKKQVDELSKRIDDQKTQVASDLTALKSETTDTFNSKIGEVSTQVGTVKTDVEGLRTDVAADKSELEQHTADLKRMIGDMGVMSGLIATNSTDLAKLRELGERNYYEFTLSKSQKSVKIGGVNLALKKADPKHSRYTLDVLADDKMVEKKDRTINEPVQVYASGARTPNEIVVNEVKKDTVVGYVSVPKVVLSRR
jgi:DNA repair exonuclease SbcCD ATPase subunit